MKVLNGFQPHCLESCILISSLIFTYQHRRKQSEVPIELKLLTTGKFIAPFLLPHQEHSRGNEKAKQFAFEKGLENKVNQYN